MPRSFAWLLVALLLGGFVAVVLFVLRDRADSGKGMPAYSVFSEAPRGLGESAHVLRQAGYRVVALTRPVQNTRQEGLLISVQPPRQESFGDEGMGPADAKGLLAWVEAGNTFLVCGDIITPLHQQLGVSITTPAGESDSFAAVSLSPGQPYLDDIERLSVGREATLSLPAGARTLWQVKGGPGAIEIEKGKGRVILVADPGLLTRRGLVREDGEPRDDNVVFLFNVARLRAREGRVLFDEYHHGLRASVGFWSYLGYHQQRWTVLPILIVVGVLLWRLGVRLGPAIPRTQGHRADAVDYASALARLYQKAGARKLVARILVRDFLTALTSHLRLRRTALPALILSAWQKHDRGPRATKLQELLRGVAEVRKGDVSDRQLLHWARAFDQFVAEVREEAGPSGKRPGKTPGRG